MNEALAEQVPSKMTRNDFSRYARKKMNEVGLEKWRLRLVSTLNSNTFLGKCSYKEHTIYLNSHHLDTHGDAEVLNTINHELAHALSPGCGHNDMWAAKARELGCDNTLPCATYGLSEFAIDAIRSGDLLEVEYEEQVIRTPKYKVTRFIDKCEVCDKVAKEVSTKEFRSGGLLKKLITLECGHIRIVDSDSQSAFDLMVSNFWQPDVASCKHEWDKNLCVKCREYRLFDYQVLGARFLEKQNGRAAIFDEMGLGKTPQTLAYLKYHPEAFPILVVGKANNKYQWMKEIVRWLGEEYFPQVISDGKSGIMPGLKCYITTYDLLRRFDTAKLKKIGIKTIVLDEVQAIKNPDTARTQEVRKIARDIPNMIPLSGTPWKNRGSEFFVVLNMLDPRKFWSYKAFIHQWVDTYWDGNKEKEGGIRQPEKFKEYIKDLAIRRERSEVMPELPLISRVRLNCQIEEHAGKAYDAEVSDFVKFWNEKVIGGEEDTSETNQSMIARLQKMRHILGLAKIPTTMEHLEEFIEETDRKIVVFGHHKDVCEIIYRQAKNLNVPVYRMSADLSASERDEVQEKFNKTAKCIMVASTLASGEALNLQTCSDCIMHERQWNPMNEEQAEGRFIRIGQTAQAVTATYVHASQKGSTDLHLDRLIEQKRKQFHAVMNKGAIPVWNEKNLMKELAQSIVDEATA